MTDITQRLGFDAAQAIKSLTDLSVAINTVNAGLVSMKYAAQGANLGPVQASAVASAAALSALNKQAAAATATLGAMGTAGAGAAQKVAVGFETMARVVQTQLIVRGLRQLIDAFFDASEAAGEFERTIARTVTIAGGATFDELSVQVRQLAIDIGKPIEEVSEAAFQTLQNDVGNTAESMQFLAVASRLATSQGASLQSAMNSLTSIMKAYGETSDTAAANADTLFVAIDKGRLTLEELENRLGTINPLAAELGLEFEQTAAAAASMTQAGLNPATALTQLRNVMTKLLDPTEELQEAFERLGVNSGQELVQKFGGQLPKVLQGLKSAFNDSEAAAANAFGTIRGQLGVLNLLANEASLFTDILAEFPDKAGRAANAAALVDDTNVRKFEKELAKLNDTMLELGKTSLALKVSALEFTNFLADNIPVAAATVTALGSTLVLSSATGVAAITALRTAFVGLIASFPLAAVAGLSAFLISDSLTKLSRTGKEIVDKGTKDAAKTFSDASAVRIATTEKETNLFRAELKERESGLSSFFAQTSKLYEQDFARYKDYTDRIAITSTRLAEEFVSGREDLLSNIDSFITGIDDRIKAGTKSLTDANQKLADFDFDQSNKGLTDSQKAYASLTRATQAAAAAQAAFAGVGLDKASQEQARSLGAVAEARAKDALSAAEQTKNQGLINQAAAKYRTVLQQNANLEGTLIKKLAGLNRQRLGEQRDEVQRLANQEKVAAEKLAALNNPLDQEGKTKTSTQLEADQREAVRLGQELLSIRQKISRIPIIDVAGLRGESNKIATAFEQGISKARYDFSGAVNQLQSALTSNKFKAVVELSRRSATGNEDIDAQLAQIDKDITAPADNLAAKRKALQGIVEDQIKASATSRELGAQFTALADQVETNSAALIQSASFYEQGRLGLKAYGLELLGVSKAGIQASEKGNAFQFIKDAQGVLSDLANNGAADQAIAKIDSLAESLGSRGLNEGQLSVAQKTLEVLRLAADKAREVQLNNLQINTTTFDDAKLKLLDIDSQLKNIGQQLDLNTQKQVEFNKAAAATTVGAASPIPKITGGPIFKAVGGGVTRGQDQHLVAAAEGEHITSARNSGRFFAQLRAINSGSNPVYREQGGPVTNVGDINVNINSSGSGPVDGRQLATSLRRELRRNSSSLKV